MQAYQHFRPKNLTVCDDDMHTTLSSSFINLPEKENEKPSQLKGTTHGTAQNAGCAGEMALGRQIGNYKGKTCSLTSRGGDATTKKSRASLKNNIKE